MASWFEVTVEVPCELSEAVASILMDLGSPGLECFEHDGGTSLVAYFRSAPPLDDLLHLSATVASRAGRPWTPVIRSRLIDEQNWAEEWKRHFTAMPVGRQLVVSPPWDLPSAGDRVLIVIEPAMAFGTGQHPTTRGCLELIESEVARRSVFRALDVGTGSGILAIALAKLGVRSVYAIDNDPAACTAAVLNSERNNTTTAVSVIDDWKEFIGPFDLIVANLFTNLLREMSDKLTRLLAPDGVLICSGFLAADEGTVLAAYSALAPVCRRQEEGWVTLALTPRGNQVEYA